MNRVIYIGTTDDIVYGFGYDYNTILDKKSSNAPKQHVVSTNGYIIPTAISEYTPVEINNVYVYSKQGDNINTLLLEAMDWLINDDTNVIIQMTTKVMDMVSYIKYGEAPHSVMNAAISMNEDKRTEIVNRLRGILMNDDIEMLIHKNIFGHISTWYKNTLIKLAKIDGGMSKTFPGKGYWKVPRIQEDLLYGRYLIVNPDDFKQPDSKYKFMTFKVPDSSEEYIGRKLNMVVETVVYLSNPNKLLLYLIDKMITLMDSDRRLVIIDMNSINDYLPIKTILDYGITIPVKTNTQFKITTLDGSTVIKTIHPPGLSRRIIDSVSVMDINTADGFIDLMDDIYVNKNGRKVINPDIPMSGYYLEKDTGKGKILIQLNLNMLPRNNLKRIEKDIDTVREYYKVKKSMIYHFGVIRLRNGDTVLIHAPNNSVNLTK